MADARPGAVHWMDHYVVPISDTDRWVSFHEQVLGAKEAMDTGGGNLRQQGSGAFVRPCPNAMAGGFRQPGALQPTKGLGEALPRYGHFIRSQDIDEHLRRLEFYDVPHTDPIRTSAEGQDGSAIYFEDPDGNQLEFWAPDNMPNGAMDDVGPLGVGKISSAVFESRDFARTADFYQHFWAIDPIQSSQIPIDTLSFALAGGGRIVFKKVDRLERRTGRGMHLAMVVREDEFMVFCQRLWDGISDLDPSNPETRAKYPNGLPPHTTTAMGRLRAGKLAGQGRTESDLPWPGGRSDSFVDWDDNHFHMVGGIPREGSMASYQGIYLEDRVLAAQGVATNRTGEAIG